MTSSKKKVNQLPYRLLIKRFKIDRACVCYFLQQKQTKKIEQQQQLDKKYQKSTDKNQEENRANKFEQLQP